VGPLSAGVKRQGRDLDNFGGVRESSLQFKRFQRLQKLNLKNVVFCHSLSVRWIPAQGLSQLGSLQGYVPMSSQITLRTWQITNIHDSEATRETELYTSCSLYQALHLERPVKALHLKFCSFDEPSTVSYC
jgi:hypothetical protein